MPEIENTSAIIKNDPIGGPQIEIFVLSGMIGEQFVKLYMRNDISFNENQHRCPFLGITFIRKPKHAYAWVTTNCKQTPLYKGDFLVLVFEDNLRLTLTFNVGGISFGKEKRNIVSIEPVHAIQIISSRLIYLQAFNQKTGEYTRFDFFETATNQYHGQIEGGKLFCLAAKRVFDEADRMLQME